MISGDLGRAHGAELDRQIIAGSASGQNLTGLLSVSGILTQAGAVTNTAAFAESVWKAFSALAGSSGYGTPAPADYVTILHPRRLAWFLGSGNTATVPTPPQLPGTVVPSAGIPTNLGGSTSEDVVLIVERSQVILVGGRPEFRTHEDVGSNTLTVRISSWNQAALVTLNATAVAKVTGLTPPSGF